MCWLFLWSPPETDGPHTKFGSNVKADHTTHYLESIKRFITYIFLKPLMDQRRTLK